MAAALEIGFRWLDVAGCCRSAPLLAGFENLYKQS